MGVTVAEYLGVRVDAPFPIPPVAVAIKPVCSCPFRNHNCLKTSKGQHPVCSVRDADGLLWIVCEHRLCATQPKAALLNEHQRKIIRMVANIIFEQPLVDSDILTKREVSIPITATSDYHADYVMWRGNVSINKAVGGDKAAIVEMQGGGETTGTEKLTAIVKAWAASGSPSNSDLSRMSGASPLVTNAWRRQQEQFLVKGSVAMLTGAKMVFCVGPHLYDYLMSRITTVSLQDLQNSNWTLALVAFEEDVHGTAPSCAPDSIQFRINLNKTKFTNYFSFVQALTNQGAPQPSVFAGVYETLTGVSVTV